MKKNTQNKKSTVFSLFLFLALLTPLNSAFPFAFIFAGEANGVQIVTHPIGYSGSGGVVTVTVGVDPTSANASDIVISTQNVIAIFNEAMSTTGNLDFGPLPTGLFDFESVLLHEMGHSLGLAHCNIASESGLEGSALDYTKSTDGADNMFGQDPGADGIIGSADDVRGDDVNLNYFKIADNSPFTIAGTVDQTTYSRDLVDLPSGNFSANGARSVGAALGFINTETVMQQGTFGNEQQQTLSADDVAGLKFAMSGIDEISGTADDYTLVLAYIGLTASADIVIDFDDNETGFAVSQSGAVFIGPNHLAVTTNNIYFNTAPRWYFNTVALASPPAIVCAPYTTVLDGDGTVTIQASDVDGGTTDSNGDTFTLSIDQSTFTCADIGDNTVNLTATDSNGMSSSCTTTVTILAGGSPLAAICQNPTVSLDAAGSVTITTADIDGGSTVGNCGLDSIYMTSGFEENTINVSTVSDFNGGANRGLMFDIVATNNIEINSFDIRPFNTEDGTASYEVYYKTGSSIGSETTPGDWALVASPNITSVTNAIVAPLNLSLGINVAVGERVAFYISPIDGSALLIANGTDTGTLYTSDSNLEYYEGGLQNYPFNGSVGAFVFNGNIVYSIPALFDGNFDCSNVGENTITLNVKDAGGDIETCDATVTIVDDEDPTITCAADLTNVSVDPGACFATLTLNFLTTADNCGVASVTNNAPDTFPVGLTTVTWTVTDTSGRTATCEQNVTVVDDEDPVLTCPGDEVVNPLAGDTTYVVPDYFALGNVTGMDNCTTVLVNTSQNPAVGTSLAFGVYTVTCNAEDENGNVGTCTFQLTVEDDALGVDDVDLDISSITLYPSPVKNSIFIKNPQSFNLKKVNIYDLSGRLVISKNLENMQSEGSINVSTLQSALYICIIESDKGQLVRRIVKD